MNVRATVFDIETTAILSPTASAEFESGVPPRRSQQHDGFGGGDAPPTEAGSSPGHPAHTMARTCSQNWRQNTCTFPQHKCRCHAEHAEDFFPDVGSGFAFGQLLSSLSRSTIRPAWITRSRTASLIIESRCTIMKLVQSRRNSRVASEERRGVTHRGQNRPRTRNWTSGTFLPGVLQSWIRFSVGPM